MLIPSMEGSRTDVISDPFPLDFVRTEARLRLVTNAFLLRGGVALLSNRLFRTGDLSCCSLGVASALVSSGSSSPVLPKPLIELAGRFLANKLRNIFALIGRL